MQENGNDETDGDDWKEGHGGEQEPRGAEGGGDEGELTERGTDQPGHEPTQVKPSIYILNNQVSKFPSIRASRQRFHGK